MFDQLAFFKNKYWYFCCEHLKWVTLGLMGEGGGHQSDELVMLMRKWAQREESVSAELQLSRRSVCPLASSGEMKYRITWTRHDWKILDFKCPETHRNWPYDYIRCVCVCVQESCRESSAGTPPSHICCFSVKSLDVLQVNKRLIRLCE